MKNFWNAVRNIKRCDNDNGDDITVESLTGHFEEMFRPLGVNKDTHVLVRVV